MDRAISLEARRVDLRIEPPFRIGRARIDPSAHEIKFGKTTERIQPQALKVLVSLHDKSGQVVSRDELIDRCWDGRIVGEDVINRCISILRQIAVQAGAFQIDTVPRAGYRLLESSSPRKASKRVFLMGGMAVAAVAVVAVTGLFLSRPSPAHPAVLSVVVLPFTADKGSAIDRQVATDATQSVARMLSDSGLSVESGGSRDGLVVSGHVGGDPQNIIASVNLEDPRRHAILMSRQLEIGRDHAGDLPDQVGANVAGSLSWASRLIQGDEQHPSDPAFISQMLDQFSNEEFNFWRSYEFARQHAPAAPNSAIAQWDLAMDTGLLMHGLPLKDRPAAVAGALAAANRARALDPNNADFNVPWCLLHPQVRMIECEDRLRAGLAADAQASWAPSFLGHLMNNVGRTNEAVMLEGQSLAQDEYVPAKMAETIMTFEAAGATEQAKALYQRATRLWPHFHFLFRLRVRGMAERGDFDALGKFEQEVGPANLPPFYDSALGLSEAVKAHSVSRTRAACPKTSIDQKVAQCMLAFAQLGDLDDAFAYADLVYPPRRGRTAAEQETLWFADPFVLDTAFLVGRGAAPLRRDPRFLALAGRLGLLDYWRTGRLPDFCTRAHEPVCAHIRGRSS